MFHTPMRSAPRSARARIVVCAATALVALLPALPAQTGGVPAPGFGRLGQDANDTTITLNVKDQPLADVVKHIAERAQVNIVVAEGVVATVTVTLDRVPWKVALEIVAGKAGCVIIAKAPNVYWVESPPRVSMTFTGADIKEVIASIAKLSGQSVVASGKVEGVVHMSLTNIPWRTALDTVAKSLGYVVVEESWGVYRVVDPSTLEAQLETRVFPLRYLRPPAPYAPKIKTEYAEGQVKAPTQDPDKDFTVLTALRDALSKNGKLEYISKSNIIVVKDIPPVLDALGRMLAEIDVEPGQVFVDVKFVTTSNTDALSYGVDIGETGLQASITGGAIPHRLPFNLGAGGWDDHIIASESETGPEGLAADALASAVTFGRLDFTQMAFTLNLLKKDDQSRIVQAPKLIVLDNQEGTIFVGRTIRFAETEAQQGQSGGLTYSIKEAKNSPVQTGFQLYLIPHIIPGTNKIMMTVIPEAEQLVGRSSDPNLQGFQIFTSGEGTANEVSIALPQVASSTLITTMMLESGQTAVIGGLITDTDTENVNKIPILGDIPILNFFFKSVDRARIRESLIVFITPRIVRSVDHVEKVIEEENQRRQRSIEEEVERIFGAEGLPPDGGEAPPEGR